MAREERTVEGLESGVDDGVAEVGPLRVVSCADDVIGGMKPYLPDYLDRDDLENGYCSYGGLDLDDMFGAFERTQNYGLAGGDRTVNDFTPEGLATQEGGVRGKVSSSKGNSSQRYP